MVPNFFNEDWRFWQIVSPQEGLNAFLHALVWGAIVIHLVVLLASDRYATALLG